jgi:CRISPR type I-E-associated protein CasA/Cse1
MTDPPAPTLRFRFNALTDPWLPLLHADGTTEWVSPVEVLCGEKDAPDLDYPRDDFRVYARLLLSAIVQALFPAATVEQLRERIEVPMRRAEVEKRIAPVLRDFDLFGPTPFLQVTPPHVLPKNGAAPFVFGEPDLYQPQVHVDGLSLPIALVALFVEQTYAGGAGRGYRAGPGGQPGAFTVVDPGSVRKAAWANTLASDGIRHAPDGERPWSNEKRAARPRAATGLVEGLFFQARAIWLIPAGAGPCTVTGRDGPLVRLSPLQPKSELTKKPTKGEDVWQHPCAPMCVNSQGVIGAVRLSAERPAWTGLAQLLDPLSRSRTTKTHPLEGPAPVVAQWKNLGFKAKRARLLVIDFDRDKANIRRRFFEAFPLTDALVGDRDALDRLRALLEDAQGVERSLVQALVRAHDTQKHGGLALGDVRSEFWAGTEEPMYEWLNAVVALDRASDEGEQAASRLEVNMKRALRARARRIFDAHAEMSELDPRMQARIAKARRRLLDELWPRPKAPTPDTASKQVRT